MKRMLTLFLALCLIAVWMPVPVHASTVESGPCGANVEYTVSSDGTMRIFGSGEMWNFKKYYSHTSAPWIEQRNYVTSIVIEEGVTTVGTAAFLHFAKLTSISIPSTVTSIGNYAFYGCITLTDAALPDALTKIGNYAFYDAAITEANLSDNITEIGSDAFADTNLTAVTVPAGVTTVSAGCFKNCDALVSATFEGPITNVGNGAFYSCGALTEVVFKQGVTGEIGTEAFAYCPLLESIELTEGITQIKGHAFVGCKNLTDVTLPESLTYIGDSAFRETGIVSVTVPQSVTYVGSSAFIFCDELENITMYTATAEGAKGSLCSKDKLQYAHVIGDAPVTDVRIFGGAIDEFIVYYDEGTSGWEPPMWNGYLIEIWGAEDTSKTGICGDNLTWLLKDGTLTISGTGPMYDYIFDSAPWQLYAHRIENVVIGEGAVSVGDCAFYGMETVKSVSIPGSVTALGMSCFEDCTGLPEVTIPEGVTEIESYAFRNCINLKTVVMPDSLQTIGDSVFLECRGLTDVTLPSNLTELPDSLFQYCGSLTEIEIPDTVTRIGSAFHGCWALEKVTLPQNLEVLAGSFWASGLTEITIPASVKEIGWNTFRECSALKKITFLGNAPEINYDTFYGVVATAYYPAGDATWTEDVRQNYGGTITWMATCEDHEYAAAVTAPTCTEAGYTTYTCAICGGSYVADEVSASGHSYSYAVTAEPTANAEGTLTGTCANCGKTVTEALPKLNKEDYTYTVTKEPTVEATGTGCYVLTTQHGDFTFEVVLDKLPDPSQILYGDADGNGKIQTNDAKLILQHIVKMSVTLNLDACDVDGNGKIQTNDAKLILQYIVKIISQFPIENQ